MKWILKAALQRAMSLLPARERINYFFQKRITKQLPIHEETLDEKIMLAGERVSLFQKYGSDIPLAGGRFMEFGAGWDLVGPLTMYSLGVRHQLLLDITPHLKFELINNALTRLAKKGLSFPTSRISSKEELFQYFGIDYQAPLDAAQTKLPDNSLDFIGTNSTLEHIPARSLPPIMEESFRILKPGGIMWHLVDMKDHYSYFDPSISKYNFLKYSSGAWSLLNSSQHYQNRLRLPQYRNMIQNAGFEIIYEKITEASEAELSVLRNISIHSDFKSYSEPELSAQLYRVIGRKP